MSSSRPEPKPTITELLAEHRGGDTTALDRLFPLVYDELRGLARRALGRAGAATLQPTALVHEAWLKLARLGSANDRQHFLAIAARAMRQVLHNHARDARAQKRGGGNAREPITQVALGDAAAERDVDLVDLDDALEQLARLNERHARVVELRFFGGLTLEEAALELGVSTRTVEADWAMARAWLGRKLRPT